MGPAFETFLQFLFLAFVAGALLFFAVRPLMKRVWRRLCEWDARDKIKLTEQEHEEAQRREAEKEIATWCANPQGADKTDDNQQKLTPGGKC